ncbi:MAG TPA: D-aminoacylase [Vicinamibacteria bacterium]|nr:D-aminoacylase [Vicinamibacteria bacterium]
MNRGRSTLALLGLALAVPVAPASAPQAAPSPSHFDLVIANGRVVDGTGAPWFRADVGIVGDRVAAIGSLAQARASRRIDARDHVVAPGFIDMLGHSEMTLLADNRAESKVRQGITSEVTGEGGSAAPVSEATLEDARPWLEQHGIVVDWTDFRVYFDRLRAARPAINLGSFVGAAQVRQVVLGSDDVAPDAGQLRRMEELVEAAMRQGALGLSTSLIYPPGSYAKTPELIALARVAARHGGIYATHMRDEADGILGALEEAITISREAHIPVEIWHLKVAGRRNWGRMKEVVARIERARAEGLDITADMYPYVASGNGLDATVPQWAQAGGVEAMIRRFHEPTLRARILREIREGHGGEWEGWKARPPEDILIVSVLAPALQKWTGKRLTQVASEMGKSPEEALIDLVEADRANVFVARFSMNEDDLQYGLRRPWVAIDLDAGAFSLDGPFGGRKHHPRALGSMPRVLGHYARDLGLFPLEEAVRKMTSLPARRVGLFDRGLLRPGMAADVAVFDPARIRDRATFEEPGVYAEGVEYVIVNGRVVLDDGRMTDERPGRPLTRGR